MRWSSAELKTDCITSSAALVWMTHRSKQDASIVPVQLLRKIRGYLPNVKNEFVFLLGNRHTFLIQPASNKYCILQICMEEKRITKWGLFFFQYEDGADDAKRVSVNLLHSK